jgi:hypothetical protein
MTGRYDPRIHEAQETGGGGDYLSGSTGSLSGMIITSNSSASTALTIPRLSAEENWIASSQEQHFASVAANEANFYDRAALGENEEPSEGEPVDSGTVIRYTMTKSNNGGNKKVTAEFFFGFVKSSLNEVQKDELITRLDKLTHIMQLAHDNEQIALKEHVQRQIAGVVMQQEADVRGYGKYVTRETIDKFRHQVEFRTPELTELKNFPRVIPPEPAEKLREAKEAKIFDSFWVLSWNPKQEQLETVKDRVIKKDPILFGCFDFDKDTFYFVCDWIDEVCDLTLDKMVDELHKVDPSYKVGVVKPFAASDLAHIVEIAREQAKTLNTNRTRFRSDAVVAQLTEERFSWTSTGRILKALFKQFVSKM